MFKIKDKEIEQAMKVSPILLKLKANKLEELVNACESIDKVNAKNSEYKKLRKQINKVHKDYVEVIEGLGELAIGFAEIDDRVNYLLDKYEKNIKFYSEIFNGNNKQ